MSEELSAMFLAGLQQLGLDTSDATMLARFTRYRQELLEWNTRFNLTAIKDPEEVLIKHFLDSLCLLPLYDKPRGSILDIGSGAGFPGLPLKIVRPGWRVTLLEATGKRVTFLRHIVEVLQLDGVDFIQARAEDAGRQAQQRAAFDLVTARAVAALPTLLEYCAPYVRVGGLVVLPKKGELADEMARGKVAANQLGTAFKADVVVKLPSLNDGRRLLVWQQRKLCPAQYPRSGAAMAKHPLG